MSRYLAAVREVPRTLLAYAALSLASEVVVFVEAVSSLLAFALFSVVLTFVLVVFLLRGSRVVWSFVVIFGAVDLVMALVIGGPWWQVAIGLASIALLLAPGSLRFVWRQRSGAVSGETGQTTMNPETSTDSDRLAGWHVDPDFPARMRYWSASDARWLGTTKTPRKIKRAWNAQGSDRGLASDRVRKSPAC